MTAALDEVSVRAAALVWLQEVTLGGTIPVTREQLANDFHVAGQRFPLVDRGRGIRKPAGWRGALSIMTTQGRPYADEEGPDGLHRYKLRRDQGGTAENDALRIAMREHVPLIWFYGLEPGVFQAIFPVHLVGEEPALDQIRARALARPAHRRAEQSGRGHAPPIPHRGDQATPAPTRLRQPGDARLPDALRGVRTAPSRVARRRAHHPRQPPARSASRAERAGTVQDPPRGIRPEHPRHPSRLRHRDPPNDCSTNSTGRCCGTGCKNTTPDP